MILSNDIRLVIFDLDGTLIDAYKAVKISLNFILDKLQMPLVDDEVKNRVGWGVRHLIAQYVPENKVDEILPIYCEHHKQAIRDNVEFLPGAKFVLDKLREKNIALAIATNRPSFSAEIALEVLGIKDYFDYSLFGDTSKELKPSPAMLEEILEKLSVRAENTVFVGDMTIDVETGNNAGINTIAVLTGSSVREDIEKLSPFMIINNIKELLNVINI